MTNTASPIHQKILNSKPFLIASLLRITLPIFLHSNPWIKAPSSLTSVLLHPIYSVQHLLEGHFLHQFGKSFASAYISENVFHLPPLVLALFGPILSLNESIHSILFGWILSLIDVLIVTCLIELTTLAVREQEEAKEEKQMDDAIRPTRAWIFGIDQSEKEVPRAIVPISDLSTFVAYLYYCNPIIIFSGSVLLNFQNVLFLFYLLSLRYAARGNIPLAAFWVAVGGYIDVWGMVYLVPVVILAARKRGSYKRVIFGTFIFFLLWISSLFGLSYLLVRKLWTAHYTSQLNLNQPSLSTLWYFFMEIFQRFQIYYHVMVIGLPYIFILPLTIRLLRYPIELATSLLFIHSLFNPILTLPNIFFLLANICLSPRTISRMGIGSIVSLLSITVPITLFVFDYWLWLETGTGNPNYMFFQCLGCNVFLAVIFLDFVGGTLKREKARRIIAKTANDE